MRIHTIIKTVFHTIFGRSIRQAFSIIIPILIAAVILTIFNTILLLGIVPTESMTPTLEKNSFVLGLRSYNTLDKGDVVAFRHEGVLLVKRIAATEGDIVIHNGVEKIVPDDCFYMLGDNADNSFDSRYWENPFVNDYDVVAKIILPDT